MFGLKKLIRGNRLGIPKDVMKQLTTPPEHTPDAAELQNRSYNLVMLYGNEMQGGRACNPDVKPVFSDVYTVEPFVMARVRKGEMIAPVVFNPPPLLFKNRKIKMYDFLDIKEAATVARLNGLRPAAVKGELYQLTDVEVEQLDKQYSNGVFFDRVRVRVKVEHYARSIYHQIGNEMEARISEALYYEKRVHLYVARYKPFANVSILESTGLRKERKNNQNYAPRYFYTRSDGK